MLEAGREEDRAPALPVVPRELEVVAMTRHTANHVADAAPGVEAAMQEPQLGLARLEG